MGCREVVGILIFAGIFQKVTEMSLKKVVDRGYIFIFFIFIVFLLTNIFNFCKNSLKFQMFKSGCHRSSLLQLAPPCCAVTRIWKFLQHVLGYQIKQRWLFWSLSFALTWWNWHIKNPLKSARCSLLTSDRTSAQAIKIFMEFSF